MYTSTRKNIEINVNDCIIKGISDEGGLFICNSFDKFKMKEELINYDYKELAKYVFKFFFNTFNE